jgi:hypothetical protein
MFDTLDASIRDAFRLELADVRFDGDVLSELTAESSGLITGRNLQLNKKKRGKSSINALR